MTVQHHCEIVFIRKCFTHFSHACYNLCELYLLGQEGEGSKKEVTQAPAMVDESLFYCPKCNKSFPQLKPLEAHVNKCLDED